MAEYRFVTHWHIEAPLHRVYDAISDSLAWPRWWRGAEHVEEHVGGDADGIGSIRRYTWKSRLPYRLTFDAHATRIEPMSVLEAVVTGDLQGTGRWLFSRTGDIVTVRYEWYVATTKRWMNLLAPVARCAFKSNHDFLMQRGAEGLARLLNARLVAVSHVEIPLGSALRTDMRAGSNALP
jgi:uncharacterized protein YndB with AHSA1/START domain